MLYRLVAVVCLSVLAASAQSLSLHQLTSFLQSSVQMKQTDKEVAAFLSKAKLTERLDDRAVEEMQSMGIGPKTLAALKALRDQSQGLGAAAPVVPDAKPAPKPPPSSVEQASILDDVREYALNYSRTLPDYICTQVTRRYGAAIPGGRYGGRRGADPSWQLLDTLTIRLSYFDQKEDYKLILVNNSLSRQDINGMGGTTSAGDFGSMMRQIFEPATEARFEWDHWATMRGRLSYVFGYRVQQERSQWRLNYNRQMEMVSAYSGLVYVDQQTHQVLRITLEAVDLPATFPIRKAEDVLDYDYQTIGDERFLLPLKGQVRLGTDDDMTRNENEFHLYHKYSSESEIKYDTETPPPISEDQTKEQAPK